MQKLYCYVDESGQDTKGTLFVVALVVAGEAREQVRALLQQIEENSGKHKKWKKTIPAKKIAYLERVLGLPALKGKLLYAHYQQTTNYSDLIMDTIAKGIHTTVRGAYTATVLIDALGKHQRKTVGAQLRKRHIHLEKVRGLTDENDEFIRLADTLAGFVRDAIEHDSIMEPIFRKALHESMIIQL